LYVIRRTNVKKKILFFAPFFGGNGSEVVLFNLINYLNRDLFDIALVTRDDGPLLAKLDNSFPVHTYNPKDLNNMKKMVSLFNELYDDYSDYIWYVNTISQPHIVGTAKFLKVPFVLHIHEMEAYFAFLTQDEIERLIEYPGLIIACSETAADVYRILGRQKNIEVCHSSIDFNRIKPDKQKSEAIREKHGVKATDFVWVMSGRDDRNKNPLVFVNFANELLKTYPDCRFMWLGGAYKNGFSLYAKAKAEHLKISDRFLWMNYLEEDYYDYFNAADGFVLTSNSDSFPLVAIEAQALGKPVISFNSGGVKELIDSSFGRIINSRSPVTLAKEAKKVMENYDKFDKEQMVKNARQYDISQQVKKWENMLLKYF
jgi:glycosyltransferase involved in cell wall biosynthesis